MKLSRLWVKNYKNLRDCEITFAHSSLLNAVIGSNGSGKSNLIEAILQILIDLYFKKTPQFDFDFQFELKEKCLRLQRNQGHLSLHINDNQITKQSFAEHIRSGPSQGIYPDLTFVYYSGECERIRRMIKRYQKHFLKLTREPETDSYRPIFVESTSDQAQAILLALYAHGHNDFLHRFGIERLDNVSVVLNSPRTFDPARDEPKLWGTQGAVRRIMAAIDAMDELPVSMRRRPQSRNLDENSFTERRTYHFGGTSREKSVDLLAGRLSKDGDNLYQALEHLRHRGILESVNFQIVGQNGRHTFGFDHLSEGEKQLLAVVGALRLINQPDNLILLDEPDTHLNPQWSWEYHDMLREAFDTAQRERSTVVMATHDPVMISGLTREQVLIAHPPSETGSAFMHPHRNPRGQGVANLLCSSEFFGLPSSLDKETQQLLDERLRISVKDVLSEQDKSRLRELNRQLEIVVPGVSERDPEYVHFLRSKQRPGS